MKKKITEFRRLNLSLSFRILFIYLKRVVGIKRRNKDRIYLAYFYSLKTCDLRHVEEEEDYFKVVTVEGIYLYLRKYPSSDAQVLYQIWKEKEYDVVVDYIRNNFRNHIIRIVDAGANVGYVSTFLFCKLKHLFDMRFVIVEPDSGNLAVLKKNFEANGMHNYAIEKAGLFNKSCFLNLSTDFRDGKEWSFQVVEADYPTDLIGVEIPEILQKYEWDSVDFFKMDIEGSERYLFESEPYANNFLSKIKLVSIEIHEEFDPEGRIEKSLAMNNFDYFKHGEITIGFNQHFKNIG